MAEERHQRMVDGKAPPPPPPSVPPQSELPHYSYAWALYVLAGLAALAMAFAILQLHYTYGQASHRIIKILIGLTIFIVAFFKPYVALHAWVIAMPLGDYLPVTGIPGVNGPNLILMMLVASWVFPRILRHKKLFIKTRISWPLAVFIAALYFSLGRAWAFPPAGGGYPAIGLLKALWNSVLGLLVYYVVVNTVVNRGQVKSLVVSLGLGCIFSALITVRQFIFFPAHRRVIGTLGDVNDTGAYFAMCALMFAGLFIAFGGISLVKRLTLYLATALATLGTFLPKSRGAIVAFVCGFAVLTFQTSRKAFVFFLVVLALSPIWAPSFVKDRMAETRVDTLEAQMYGDPTDRLDPSAAVRLKIWGIVLSEFKHQPIWGMGYATIPFLTLDKIGRSFSAHSLYVATIGEAGLIGIAALAWLLVSCVRSGFDLSREATDRMGRGLALGFLGGTAALLVANAFGQRFLHMSIAGTYFFVAGLVDRYIYFERSDTALAGAKES